MLQEVKDLDGSINPLTHTLMHSSSGKLEQRRWRTLEDKRHLLVMKDQETLDQIVCMGLM